MINNELDLTHQNFKNGDFARHIVRALRDGEKKRFLTFLDLNDTQVEFSFNEFAISIEIVSNYILTHFRDYKSFYVLSQNFPTTLVWIIGLILNGKEICLLNPNESESEIQTKASTDANSVILSEKSLMHIFPDSNEITIPQCNVIKTLEEIIEATEYSPHQFLRVFTSGSTSRSKKVLQTEKGALFNVLDLCEFHNLKPQDIILTSMPIFHVNALYFSFFCSLLSGCELILLRSFNYKLLKKALRLRSVSIISAFPELIRVILQRSNELKELLTVDFKYIVSAASYLPKELYLRWNTEMPGRLIQGYGLSEAINFSLLMPPNLDRMNYERLMSSFEVPSVGVPLRRNRVEILRADFSPCHENEKGQIFISGDYLMSGYESQDPSLCFVDKKLPTGDLGFYTTLENGEKYFFISGRIKDIVKINGESVSLIVVEEKFADLRATVKDLIAVALLNRDGLETFGLVCSFTSEKSFKDFVTPIHPLGLRPGFIFLTTNNLRTASGKPRRGHFSQIAQSVLIKNNYAFLTQF